MIAIIGTAGRDLTRPRTLRLWSSMLDDARNRVPRGAKLVSGGAAWADHLSVALFLEGHAGGLTLHLPAEFASLYEFAGGAGTAGGTANHYHARFSRVLGISSIEQIAVAISRGASYTTQAREIGARPFMVRNKLVARDATTGALAYTWGTGDTPADGGTMNTWRQLGCPKVHVPLWGLAA